MNQKQRMIGWGLSVLALALAHPLSAAGGYVAESVGIVTEIDVRRGGLAEVRRLGAQEWRPAGPLLTLNAGDTVRVSQGASVVILLSGGRGSLKIDTTNSPFQIPAVVPTAEQSKLRRGWVLLEESFKALVKASNDSDQVTLGTRGPASSLMILTPRNGLVLPDSLVFEWAGDQSARYTVRVIGTGGVVLERRDIAGTTLVYPADAMPPTPGMHYQLQVVGGPRLADKVWFEVLSPARAAAIRHDLFDLATVDPAMPPDTLVITQAAFLVSQGLLHDARLKLITALAEKPDQAALHVLLGDVYEQVGLPDQAAESFAEAISLGSDRAQRKPRGLW
jgi:hypothetical protein